MSVSGGAVMTCVLILHFYIGFVALWAITLVTPVYLPVLSCPPIYATGRLLRAYVSWAL